MPTTRTPGRQRVFQDRYDRLKMLPSDLNHERQMRSELRSIQYPELADFISYLVEEKKTENPLVGLVACKWLIERASRQRTGKAIESLAQQHLSYFNKLFKIKAKSQNATVLPLLVQNPAPASTLSLASHDRVNFEAGLPVFSSRQLAPSVPRFYISLLALPLSPTVHVQDNASSFFVFFLVLHRMSPSVQVGRDRVSEMALSRPITSAFAFCGMVRSFMPRSAEQRSAPQLAIEDSRGRRVLEGTVYTNDPYSPSGRRSLW